MDRAHYYRLLKRFFSSNGFFAAAVALFMVSAGWIALSARYPMAFDENYHYKIIQQYSHQYSPFFTHPPAASEALGDITRYPSYLYHYLLSFVYRGLSLFNQSDQFRVIALLFLNISFFALGLYFYRKILLQVGAGRATAHVVLFFFTLIPNVVFLAGQINYDNLLVLATSFTVLLCIKYLQSLKAGQIDLRTFFLLAIVNLFSSLIVFTHLPVFFATELLIVLATVRFYQKHTSSFNIKLVKSWRTITPFVRSTLLIFVLLGLGLFLERYGYNQLRYGRLTPTCAQVLSEKRCLAYGPAGRDQKLMQKPPLQWSTGRYFLQWAGQNMYELFFTINYNYTNKPPLPIPFYVSWILTIAGFASLLWNWKKWAKNPAAIWLGFIVLVYVVSLWINNLNSFHRVGFPVAIHGRYFVHLLPFILLSILTGIKYVLLRLPRATSQKLIAVFPLLLVLVFTQGGGITSFILASNNEWYWERSFSIEYNQRFQSALKHLIIK